MTGPRVLTIGRTHAWLRRGTQAVAWLAILIAPVLGGWQRLDRAEMALWADPGWNLPEALQAHLPLGDAAHTAHEVNALRGGGTAGEYLGVPFADPIGGSLALLVDAPSMRTLVALGLPLLLGVLFGRLFCGFMCPFGTLVRGLDAVLDHLPWRPRPAIPRRRPLRFAVLALSLVAGLFGAHLVLYLALPYLLVQQSIYALWLLGGGSAVLGVTTGLLLAVAIVGPTAYCATLCPTGAALNLLGRKRTVHLTLVEPSACGTKCGLCDRACWLQLDPATGAPGADCDLCGRCASACPRLNLGLRAGRAPKALRVVGAAALALWVLAPGIVRAEPLPRTEAKPVLLLETRHEVGDATAQVSLIRPIGGVDDANLDALEVSVLLARPDPAAPDPDPGMRRARQVYQGPLTITHRRAGAAPTRAELASPNAPVSTPRRTLYRSRFPFLAQPGDRVEIAAEWLQAPLVVVVPEPGTRETAAGWLEWTLGAALLYVGLLSLAMAWPEPRVAQP